MCKRVHSLHKTHRSPYTRFTFELYRMQASLGCPGLRRLLRQLWADVLWAALGCSHSIQKSGLQPHSITIFLMTVPDPSANWSKSSSSPPGVLRRRNRCFPVQILFKIDHFQRLAPTGPDPPSSPPGALRPRNRCFPIEIILKIGHFRLLAPTGPDLNSQK